jgi:glycerol-3-phosphate acyltransferase PlsY
LSALVASACTPIGLYAAGDHAAAMLFVVLTVLLFWKHAQNIQRLRAGTEGKIGSS